MTDDPAAFDVQIEALEDAMGGAQAMAAAFSGELRRMEAGIDDAARSVASLERGVSRGLKRAIDGLVFDGDTLADALRGLGRSMLDAAYNAALKPVTSQVGGLIARGMESFVQGALPGGGAGFAASRVTPFARGGIVSRATTFPMRGGGTGLMGEAGPEAILPLARGPDGRLGVRGAGGSTGQGRPVQVTINVSTPDAASFSRSQGQIAARMGRLIARGQRNS